MLVVLEEAHLHAHFCLPVHALHPPRAALELEVGDASERDLLPTAQREPQVAQIGQVGTLLVFVERAGRQHERDLALLAANSTEGHALECEGDQLRDLVRAQPQPLQLGRVEPDVHFLGALVEGPVDAVVAAPLGMRRVARLEVLAQVLGGPARKGS